MKCNKKNKHYKNTAQNQYECFNAMDRPISWTNYYCMCVIFFWLVLYPRYYTVLDAQKVNKFNSI